MKTTQRLDWTESSFDGLEAASAGRRVIGVADELICHQAELPAGMTADTAIADYAAGYDPGDDVASITVVWEVWEDGAQMDCGRKTIARE